ncbi:C2 domain-containing protein [Gilbertella persicaria]|uniref:C2 domain-containing protein n=1 Tax=Gilbertella persicaria TaxID=101096 RepID=UPI002220B4D3|nr:C2 domain-containing protein [Gilbertella persicaria]KAI8063385.1 C2 domain-containing protein [Gilbertella persicaria]
MSYQGILYVTVIEASNLTGKDMIGKNDPYVELWIDERYKQKTRVIKNNDNPLWNQTFTFPLEGNDHKIHFKVFDKDIIGKDTIGEAKIDFSSAYGIE